MNIPKLPQHIHAIGIGGIGISALCKLLVFEGKTVSGSDVASSIITDWFVNQGCAVALSQSPDNIPDGTGLVIRSAAVPEENPEVAAARQRSIPVMTYPEVLALYCNANFGVAIAGTNGKTTTTTLTALLCVAGGFDPTVIVGGRVKEFDGNARRGQSQYMVIEADEFRRAFLHYHPAIAAITNIEEDHLDVYKDLSEIKEAFGQFIQGVREDGIVIGNGDDANVREVLGRSKKKCLTFGFGEEADVRAVDVHTLEGRTVFDLVYRGNDLGECTLYIPGDFNVMNALAAVSVALHLNMSIGAIKKVLENFRGTWRRFEALGEFKGATIVSDYAHHPTAVQKTIAAARAFYPKRKIIAVFQPHHHHRTKALFNDFVRALSTADAVFLPEIYKVEGRTEAIAISSNDLAKALRRTRQDVKYLETLSQVRRALAKTVKRGDVVLMMGAGDIYKTAEELANVS